MTDTVAVELDHDTRTLLAQIRDEVERIADRSFDHEYETARLRDRIAGELACLRDRNGAFALSPHQCWTRAEEIIESRPEWP